MKKKKVYKILCVTIIIALVVTGFRIQRNVMQTKAASYGLSNPTIEKDVVISGDDTQKQQDILSNPLVKGKVTTWDCIYFGNYWQEDTNGDGTVDQNDEKQPIKWRVLSVNGDDAFLLADQNLDCQPYNEQYTAITWETCTLRKWLNSTFFNNAFSSKEKSAIRDTTVTNEENNSTEGKNNTTDKLYLLSITEVRNEAYGFASKPDSSKTRRAKNTLYAQSCGAWTAGINDGVWWLRSQVSFTDRALCTEFDGTCGYWNERVDGRGYISYDSGNYIYTESYAVRPALHINLSSSEWEKAEKVTEKEIESATWDCVLFGSYWQNDTNGDGVADQLDEKQPIKWRVLSVEGDNAFLLADQNLDCQPCNKKYVKSVTWETCTLRNWLDETFLFNAFSPEEREMIKETTVENEDNPIYGTEGGGSTTNKVYLLSMDEVSNVAYGFDYGNMGEECSTRIAEISDYAKTYESIISSNGKGTWCLRTPGAPYNEEVSCIRPFGYITSESGYKSLAIRPVMNINLSSSLWKIEGKVTAKVGKSSDMNLNSPAPTTVPQKTATPTPALEKGTKASPTPAVKDNATGVGQEKKQEGIICGKGVITSLKNKKGRQMVIKWKKIKNAKGYQILYSTNKKFKKKTTKTKNISKTTITINNLKKKKTYYVKVRAYTKEKGKKVYGKWSSVKKVKIKK